MTATMTTHDARQHENYCDICGKEGQNIVQITGRIDEEDMDICEPCVHRMYVKCAAAFNIRPKLW
jgi:ribosome-binding protein aMBF1 (putative translation factor)